MPMDKFSLTRSRERGHSFPSISITSFPFISLSFLCSLSSSRTYSLSTRTEEREKGKGITKEKAASRLSQTHSLDHEMQPGGGYMSSSSYLQIPDSYVRD